MSAYERNEKNAEVFKDLLYSEYPLGKEVVENTARARAAGQGGVPRQREQDSRGKMRLGKPRAENIPFHSRNVQRAVRLAAEDHGQDKDDYAQQDDKLIKTKMDRKMGEKVVLTVGGRAEGEMGGGGCEKVELATVAAM